MLESERIGRRTAPARWCDVLRGQSIAWRTEILIGSVDLARIGLVGIALALQTIVLFSPGHFRPANNLFFAILVPSATLASLVACLLIALPLRQVFGLQVRRVLCASAFVSLIVLSVIGVTRVTGGVTSVLQGRPYTNDGAVMDLYASQQVLHAHNPYLKTDIVQALAAINAPAITTTPLMEGQFRGARAYPSDQAIQHVFLSVLQYQPRTIPPEFESKYNYPSGSFLFILPFVWAGISDMRFLYAIAILAMGWYLARRMPRTLRPFIPLLLLANVPLLALTGGGQPDPLYALFLMVALAEWPSSRVSPIAMGLAVATKQLAWFFAPFYFLLVLRHFGWREALRRTGLIGGIFVLLNGPFIVQSPSAYLASVAAPMSDPMFPLGIGIVGLFVANVLPLAPKIAFTLAELASWAGGLWAMQRFRVLAPAAIVVLGALPLFFAWRSLVNYFYLVPYLVLAVVLADSARRLGDGSRTSTRAFAIDPAAR
ncbi:MAG: hypothetical protein ACRDFX_03805 [Chloroflexota bacterium]